MIRMVSARQLIGRRIVGLRPNPFPDGRGGTAHEPVLELDDGTELYFSVEEAEETPTSPPYGVLIGKRKRRKQT